MVPAPTANPHAELVTECFEEYPGFDSPARNWSPSTPPDKRSWWGVVLEPAVGKKEDHLQGDVGCEVDNMPRSSGGWLPGLAGHGGEFVGQGQHTCAVVGNMGKVEVRGRCTLPSLKDLGLDVYIRKRD